MRYIAIGSEEELKSAAAKHAPLAFRALNLSMPIALVERRLRASKEWESWKKDRRSGDRVWPFMVNRGSMAMRRGFVIVRAGVPLQVILTEVS